MADKKISVAVGHPFGDLQTTDIVVPEGAKGAVFVDGKEVYVVDNSDNSSCLEFSIDTTIQDFYAGVQKNSRFYCKAGELGRFCGMVYAGRLSYFREIDNLPLRADTHYCEKDIGLFLHALEASIQADQLKTGVDFLIANLEGEGSELLASASAYLRFLERGWDIKAEIVRKSK